MRATFVLSISLALIQLDARTWNCNAISIANSVFKI